MAHGDALATATEEARQLCRDNDLARAHTVLRDALADVPDWADDTEVATATRLYASVLAALGEAHTAQPWAARAYGICLEALGAAHPETLAAAATLASVLRTLGGNERAAHLYAYLADTLSIVEGRRSPAALAARADLATVLHAQGDCERARAILAQAHEEHRDTYGDGDPATIKMAARLGRMARDCGDFLAAHEYFDEARAACQRYLDPDDPLATAVTALVHAPADPSHSCGAAPDEPPLPEPEPVRAAYAAIPPPRRPDAVEWPPDVEPGAEYAARPAGYPGQAAGRHDVTEHRHAAGHRPNAAAVRGPGSGGGSVTWAEVRRQAARTAAPQAAPRRMTARVGWLTVAAVLLIAVSGAGALALARTRTGDPAAARPTPIGPTTTDAGPSAPAPREVRLTDRGTSVILNWTLPPGAEGPLFVSGASGGSPPRPFQTLLPGSTTYTIHGLNPQIDYCFTLTLVYSTEVTAGTDKVCTRRGPAPAGTPTATPSAR